MTLKNKTIFFVVLALLSATIPTSCSYFKKRKSEGGTQLARVYDKYLYLEDVIDEMPSNITDTAEYLQTYAENWTNQQVVLRHAENNLTAEQVDLERELESYKNSLIIYAFEKELVNQKLDTVVSKAEIEAYYADNSKNFELKDNIIKVAYIKVKKNAPKLNKLKEWYKSDSEGDKKLLQDYCNQFAENYFLDEESWLLFDDLLKEIPIQTYDKEQYLKNNRFIELTDSTNLYFVNIKGFKIKDSVSPISFEYDNIRSIILNKRKLTIIETMKRDVMNEALNSKEIEIKKK